MRRGLDEITGLTGAQSRQAYAIADMIGSDGTASTTSVLALFKGKDPRGALRQFKSRFNKVSGDELEFVFDGRKRDGVWFTGTDPLAQELSERSEAQVGRHSRDETVEAYVVENDLYAPSARIHISFSQKDGKLANDMAELIEQQMRVLLREKADLIVTRCDGIPTGEDREKTLDRWVEEANTAVVLLSPDYLDESAERDRVASHFPHPVIVKLKALPDGASFAPFDPCDIAAPHIVQETRGSSSRSKIAQIVILHIHRILCNEIDDLGGPARPDELVHPDFFAQRLFEHARLSNETTFVSSHAQVGAFEEAVDWGDSAEFARAAVVSRNAIPAMGRLIEWANNREDKDPGLCALLGDLGTGKTTTSILLTRELLARRKDGQDVPLPIYFDLRDLDVDRLPDFGLRSMLEQMLRQSSPTPIDVDRALEIISAERCLVVFDGLDEVLVHLEEGAGQRLARGLLQTLTLAAPENNSDIRLMLTCRSQYFRSVREEFSFFSGQNRERVRGEDYLVLTMLPFNEDQILEYLERNVPGSDPHRLLDTIRSVHDLHSLAQQPVLLAMIREVLPEVEAALADGRRFRSVDLYERFVNRWLERDDGKHTLLPEHKCQLMSRLAREVWVSGRRTWSAKWMEQWLLGFLHEHPEMERDYSARMPTQWKQDFRTATFLSRRGNDFAFAHSSLLEYFLARSMADALLTDDRSESFTAWDIPRPSQESLNFFGEILDGLNDVDCQRALKRLAKVAHSGSPRARAAVLAYILLARSKRFPIISTRALNLSSTDLRHWELGTEAEPLDLTGVPFTEARLDDAVLTRVRLDRTNAADASFLRARLIKCSLIKASLENCNLSGTVFRQCNLTDIDIRGAIFHRTQLLFSHPIIEGDGVLIAPAPAPVGNTPRTLMTYPGLNMVARVVWSPDGTRFLTTDDNGVRTWDAATGETTQTLTTNWTRSAAWSPDGTRILTTGPHGVHMWDTTTGRTTQTLTTDRTNSAAWSPDGTRILTTGPHGVHMWDTTTGRTTQTLTTNSTFSAVWSPDGTRILTADDNGVHMWDTVTGETTQTLTTDRTNSAVWSPDGTRILTADDNGVHMWDTVTGETTQTLTTDRTNSAVWSPDGTRILTTGRGGVHMWDTVTGRTTQTLTTNSTFSAVWSPDGTRILTTGLLGVHMWDAATGETTQTLTTDTNWTNSAVWSPDGTRILTADDNGVHMWDAATGETTQTLTTDTNWTNSAVWSPDGTRILTTGPHGVHMWDAATGETTQTLTTDTNWTNSAVWSPDGTRILTTGPHGVHMWDAATGETTQTLTTDTNWTNSAAWSPDGTRILTADDNGVHMWDATTGETTQTLTTNWIESAAWSPDGTRILTTDDNGVRTWDATTGETTQSLTTNWIESAAWSPDGTHILTTGRGGVHMWDATTGRTTQTLTTDRTNSAVWSPDGTRILTTGPHGVHMWDATTGQPFGIRIDLLPKGALLVRDATTLEIIGASTNAWRWLGYEVMVDGQMTRLPAELNGPLPPLPRADS